MKVLCVGGGSAGHVVPALPIIERLADEGARVVFVGTRTGLEADLVAGAQTDFVAIAAGKLRRYMSWENVTDVFRIGWGTLEALRIVRRERPNVVFSKGGFVAFPVVLAAWLLRVPIVAHESDLTPGLANRLCKKFVTTMCVSFDATRLVGFSGKQVHTGSPMRPELLGGVKSAGVERLGFASQKPILLVTGGSLGAEALNRVLREALAGLTGEFNVVHICGAGKTADIDHEGYRQYEYVDEGWGDLLAAADVIVSRAGANALFELLSLRKPALLIPLSEAASRGDQVQNARYAEERGFVRVLAEEELSAETLETGVRDVLAGTHELAANLAAFEAPDAVERIVAEIKAAAKP